MFFSFFFLYPRIFLKVVREKNSTRLPIIWIGFQGVTMDAYLLDLPADATPKTDSKTTKIV